jgi:hypothetical protein
LFLNHGELRKGGLLGQGFLRPPGPTSPAEEPKHIV